MYMYNLDDFELITSTVRAGGNHLRYVLGMVTMVYQCSTIQALYTD